MKSLNSFYEKINNVFYFEKNIDNLYKNQNKSNLLSNHPANPKGLAAKNVFNKRNIKLISFQHGVSAEISGSHDSLLFKYDSSASDQYYAFNNAAVSVAKENPFNVVEHYVYGMPKKDIKDNKTYLSLKESIRYCLYLINFTEEMMEELIPGLMIMSF